MQRDVGLICHLASQELVNSLSSSKCVIFSNHRTIERMASNFQHPRYQEPLSPSACMANRLQEIFTFFTDTLVEL